jgi:hypothetical protein
MLQHNGCPLDVTLADIAKPGGSREANWPLCIVGALAPFLAFAVNEETIWRSTCIYASDKSLASFVIPRIEGKAAGAWQPSAG